MVTKIYINTDFNAAIPCPKCKKAYQKNVKKFIGYHKEVRLKYTCRCSHQFYVWLERRRFIRKPKNLKGYLVDSDKKIPLRVVDISRYGVKIKLSPEHLPETGNILTIEFVLDDPGYSKVKKQVKVVRVLLPNTVGCEFLTAEHYDRLGKYFLFHF